MKNILLGVAPPQQDVLAKDLEALGYHVLTDNDGAEVSRDLLITDNSLNGVASAMACVRFFPNLSKVLVFACETDQNFAMALPAARLTAHFHPWPETIVELQRYVQAIMDPKEFDLKKLEVVADFAGNLYFKDTRQ